MHDQRQPPPPGHSAEVFEGDLNNPRGLIEALRSCRIRLGYGYSDVAERAGVDRATLSKLESGSLTNPTLATLSKYAEALGVRLMWRVTYEPPSSPAQQQEASMLEFDDLFEEPIEFLEEPAAGAFDRQKAIDEFIAWLGTPVPYQPVYLEQAQEQLAELPDRCFAALRGITDAEVEKAIQQIMTPSVESNDNHPRIEEWRRCLHAVADQLLRPGDLTGPGRVKVVEAMTRLSGYHHHSSGLFGKFRPTARKLVELLFLSRGVSLPYLKIVGEWDEAVPEPEKDTLISLWKFAGQDRARASRILCFICSHDYSGAYTTVEIHEKLRQRTRRDDTLLNRWSVSSPSVDVIARSIAVKKQELIDFLNLYGFDQNEMTKPSRDTRRRWFERWNHLKRKAKADE
jgi:transcriptional regulator with XRE-family HTH domain